MNLTLDGALSWPAREVITREAALITGPERVAVFRQIADRYPTARRITAVPDDATYNRAASGKAPLCPCCATGWPSREAGCARATCRLTRPT